jgi:IS5 family transposase
MKVHIGVDARSGLTHTAGVTTGKVHDAKVSTPEQNWASVPE